MYCSHFVHVHTRTHTHTHTHTHTTLTQTHTGVVGELYHGAMLEPSGGQSIVPVPMAVRVVDGEHIPHHTVQ